MLVAEEDFEGNVLTGIQASGFKFIRANAGNPRGLPERALFDHVADPGETTNLARGGPQICGTFPAGTPA